MTNRKTGLDHNKEQLAKAPTSNVSRFVMDMNDPVVKEAVITRAHATVKLSFHPTLWPMRNQTQQEYSDRFQIALSGYQAMRDEEQTSREQALDSMEFFVEEYLDQKKTAAKRDRPRATWIAN